MKKTNNIPEKLTFFTALKFLSKYLKGHRIQFIAFYIGWFLDTAAAVASPIIFGIMINQIVYYKNTETFFATSAVFLFLTLFNCIMYYLIYQVYAYNWVMFNLGIKRDVFKHILYADAQFMADASTGDLIANVQNYTGECMHFVVRNVIHNINNVLTVIFCVIYIFVISWQVGLLMTVLVPVSVFISLKFGKKIRKYGESHREFYSEYSSFLFEMINNLRDIRFLGAESKITHDFVKHHKNMFRTGVKSGLSIQHAHNIIYLSTIIIQLIIYTFVAVFSAVTGLTIGLIIVILAYFGMLTQKIDKLSGSYMDAQNRVATIQRIYDFLKVKTEDEWNGKEDLHITKGEITFDNIDFAYNKGNTVLNGFSLTINPGERCAMVGKSGCGKTTLAYMLIGFYSPISGGIFIDGQKLSDCNLKSIRQNIGLVQQDVLIFDGTIRENLLLGKPKATHEEIENAAKQAGIFDFIEGLPEQFETVIGSKGIGVSGGQKQRIAIARIYLKNPKIIIFDEATSSLDKETEEAIHETWKSVLADRTSIIIAHRESSVMLCDRTALIEDGKLAEIGNPVEMKRESEKFRTLFAVKNESSETEEAYV